MSNRESHYLESNQYWVWHLSKLYKHKPQNFESVCDYLPFCLYINEVDGLDMRFANQQVENQLEMDKEKLIFEGFDLIRKISDKKVMNHSLSYVKDFQTIADMNSVCSYFQRMIIYGKLTWCITYKVFISKNRFLNIMHPLNKLEPFSKSLCNVLDTTFNDRNGWAIFQSLTKREKEIMKLLAEGFTSKQVAEKLFVSKLTADTHRKNIFNKLQVKTHTELFKMAQGFDMVGLE